MFILGTLNFFVTNKITASSLEATDNRLFQCMYFTFSLIEVPIKRARNEVGLFSYPVFLFSAKLDTLADEFSFL